MNGLKCAVVASAIFAATALSALAQAQRASPHDVTSAVIGGKRAIIYYGRPYAKGRTVWGTLVPWDKPWRIGADEATTLITQGDIVIGGTTLPKGVYTLYMVPSENGVTKLAISKTIGGWGIPVDVDHDLAQVDLKKDPLDTALEQLTISVGRGGAGGVIKIGWANTQYSIEFKNAP